MYRILIVLFLLIGFQSYGQPETAKVAIVDGKKYYIHIVEAGNTLYGLQRLYGVPVDEILKVNPELSAGLKEGQLVKIPYKEVPKPAPVFSDYTVNDGETLYGISKKFNTTVDELISLNPGVENGIKKGQLIKVPGKIEEGTVENEERIETVETNNNPFTNENVTKDSLIIQQINFNDSIIHHVVLPQETLYSISKRFMVPSEELMKLNNLKSTSLKDGQVLSIPVKKERNGNVPVRSINDIALTKDSIPTTFEKKERYEVALMLPFFLDYGEGYSAGLSEVATQFYMGAMIAVDSLRQLGFNAEVRVFDTKNDSLTVMKILKDPSMKNLDLIIGPLNGPNMNNMKQVADFCKIYKIRMICPSTVEANLLKNNPFVFASMPTNVTMMRGMATFLLNNSTQDNIILVKPTKEKDLILYEAFRLAYNDVNFKGIRPKLIETTMDGFGTYITKGINTVFVVPTTDKSTALKFMSALNKVAFKAKAEDLIVYGTREWMNYDDISNSYKNKYNFHFPSPNLLNYYDEQIIDMNKVYRKKYNSDLTKSAIQGYDLMMYFCGSMLFGKNVSLLMNEIQLQQVASGDGFENTKVFILEQEDYELIRAGESTK